MLLVALAGVARATDVAGTITDNEWSAAGSPYRVTAQCTVPAGNTLTIEAGVDVLFDADVQFTVLGALRVHGTETDSVRFLKGTASEWGGIRISGGDSSFFSYARISDGSSDGSGTEEGGGGLFIGGPGSRLTMDHCVVSGNSSAGVGGGMLVYNYCTALLTDCAIRHNMANGTGNGGGIYSAYATTTLDDCVISDNAASTWGGGAYGSGGTVTFNGCTFAGNLGDAAGNALSAEGNADAWITDCIIWDDSSDEIFVVWGSVNISHTCIRGGVPAAVADSGGNISDSPLFVDAANGDYRLQAASPCIGTASDGWDMGAFTFEGGLRGEITTTTWTAENSPYRVIGAVTIPAGNILTIEAGVDVLFDADVQFVVQGALRVHGTETDSVRFLKGTASEWGGIRISGGDSSFFSYARISDGDCEGSGADDSGGGLFIGGSGSRLTMEHCVVSGNSSAFFGGGMVIYSGSRVLLTDCAIRHNMASGSGYGGGILSFSSTTTLNDCVISHNSADMRGGGVHCLGGTVMLSGCTFAGNTAGADGNALIAEVNANVSVTDCILWDDAGDEITISSATVAVRSSCIQGGVPTDAVDDGGNIASDPLFVDAANGDYHLQAGSPCIGTASDGWDMGAYAAEGVRGTVTTTTWTAENSPYRVIGAVTLPAGNTLTIEAGVNVLFDADVQFVVNGALRVHGTETDSVRFLNGTAAEWGGIRVSGGDSSSFEYTRISDGNADATTPGNRGGGLYASGTGTRVAMSHCVVSGNEATGWGGGLSIGYSAALEMADCAVRGNATTSEGGGLFVFSEVSVTMTNCDISANSAPALGGGFATSSDVTAELTDCVVSGNHGGGVHNYRSVLTMTGSVVSDNEATTYGGALFNNESSTATLTKCTLADNAATSAGGGLFNHVDATATLTDCIVWGNTPEALYRSSGTIQVDHSCIEGGIPAAVADSGDNVSGDPLFVDAANGDYHLQAGSPCIGSASDGWDMGAFTFEGGLRGEITTTTWTAESSPYHVIGPVTLLTGNTLTIEAGVDVLFDADVQFVVNGALRVHGTETDSVRFLKGTAEEWGGIRVSGGDSSSFEYTRISDGHFDGSGLEEGGGGLSIVGTDSRLTMDHCVVSDNSTVNFGGGVFIYNGCNVSLTNCAIRDNSAAGWGYGGGIYRFYATLALTECVISGNIGVGHGGGIYNYTAGVTTFNRCTFSGNSATGGNGDAISNVSGANASFTDCILWDASSDEIAVVSGTVTVTHTCIKGGVPAAAADSGGNISGDPLFVDAANGDYHLQAGSPCIGSASDGWDMGAFTFEGGIRGTITTTTWTAENSPYHVIGPITLLAGNTLTIEPGVDVVFEYNAPFVVNGIVRAHGTEEDSVRFIAGAVEKWGGLRFFGGDSSAFVYTRVSDAYGTGATRNDSCGGGFYVSGAGTRVTMEHGVISGNGCAWSGAGINGSDAGWASFTDCIIRDNHADHDGGGLYNNQLAEITFTNCIISGNTAGDDGGGMDNSGGIITLTDCIISGNTAVDDAGGIGNHGTSGVATITRCLIVGNTCGTDGGGLRPTGGAQLTMTNTTIADNTSTNGGAIYNESDGTACTLRNCILWGNSSPEIYVAQGGVAAAWCCVAGGRVGVGNISSDPLFSTNPDSAYHLTGGSPCIDAGSSSSDLDPDGTRADMGVYYFHHEPIVSVASARPIVLHLDQNAPNPFNPITTLRFGLPEAGEVQLVIYDMLGRPVRTLLSGVAQAGEYSLVWDGRDDAGRVAASGVYVYRLRTNAGTLVRRMTLVR